MPTRVLSSAAVALFLLAACGPFDSGNGGSGSGGAGADGGPVWTGGGSPPDAGPASSPDAGSPADGGVAVAPSECDGVVPSSPGPSTSAVVPHGSGEVCWYMTADLQGDVAAESHGGKDLTNVTWHTYSPQGAALGSCLAGVDFFGQSSGFESTHVEGAQTFLVRDAANGSELKRTLLGGDGCSGESFLSVPGGAATVGGCGSGPTTVSRFDSNGNLSSSATVSNDRVNAIALVDAQSRTLVVVWPGSAVGVDGSGPAGRWFDPALSALGDWFSLPGGTDRPYLRPLIGGGAALRSADGDWVATIASGASSSTAPPDWLSRSKTDFQIVRGGRAYAVVAKYGSSSPRNQLELYAPSGTHCGTGTFPSGDLAVTADGTVLSSGGDTGCNLTWWSQVLR